MGEKKSSVKKRNWAFFVYPTKEQLEAIGSNMTALMVMAVFRMIGEQDFSSPVCSLPSVLCMIRTCLKMVPERRRNPITM